MRVRQSRELNKKSGVTLWRQVADQLRYNLQQIANPDGRLPVENELAEMFSVNRLTLRTAVGALVEEGLLIRQQGRGTFVKKQKRLRYPISKRTRFSAGLENQTDDRSVTVLASRIERTSIDVANALGLEEGAQVLRLETLATANKTPLIRTTSWFCASRFHDLAKAVQDTNSITKGLKQLGVDDYTRNSTEIEARHADSDDMADLKLSAGGLVLQTTSLNADMNGKIIQYAVSRMAAERIVLEIKD